MILCKSINHSSSNTLAYNGLCMPKKSSLNLKPLILDGETVGQRIARIRKLQGLTQQQLASSIGIIQALVSDYERDKLRLSAEMVVRFALALNTSADSLLGLDMNNSKLQSKNQNKLSSQPKSFSRKFLRRLKLIEQLPTRHQSALLKLIDTFLNALQK
jgi:transcriptional regulator with XRE-family HTH domain